MGVVQPRDVESTSAHRGARRAPYSASGPPPAGLPASTAIVGRELEGLDLELAFDEPQDIERGKFGGVWLPLGRSILQRWWRRHPAHAAGQLARPVLEHYARKQPAKLMAIAAATGAALVLVRPWRLLSVTAVLAAVLKTSDVADVVNTLMQKNTSPPRKDPP